MSAVIRVIVTGTSLKLEIAQMDNLKHESSERFFGCTTALKLLVQLHSSSTIILCVNDRDRNTWKVQMLKEYKCCT